MSILDNIRQLEVRLEATSHDIDALKKLPDDIAKLREMVILAPSKFVSNDMCKENHRKMDENYCNLRDDVVSQDKRLSVLTEIVENINSKVDSSAKNTEAISKVAQDLLNIVKLQETTRAKNEEAENNLRVEEQKRLSKRDKYRYGAVIAGAGIITLVINNLDSIGSAIGSFLHIFGI